MSKPKRKKKPVGTKGRFSAFLRDDQLYYFDVGKEPGLKLEEFPLLAYFLLDVYFKEAKRRKDDGGLAITHYT